MMSEQEIMKTKIKVKVSDVTERDLAETNALQLLKAKALFASFPIATKTWMSLHGFPMSWLNKYWDEITK